MSDIIKKDRKLAEAARAIFGNIVKSAFVSTYDSRDTDSNSEIEAEFQQASKSIEYGVKKYIAYGGLTIYILFSNGNMVKFSNSEWATISKVENKLETL